ncbi:hypothetical protein MPH_06338 [Macrophomina phaseolina MS6]|uniref:magnesium chelatase n=1 Tax=Macrophomina phaseolina (strain MS6) TaxID=1126212 RepID=K2RV51_MACPH|nr:hypothetical protein MPH_06338 [Macrophomina phaseolina MS6]
MDHAVERVADKVQTLSDLELAALLCLVAEQHAIIDADASQLDVLTQELQLIAGSVFGLSSTVLECSEKTTLDAFGNGLLVEDEDVSYFSSPSITRDQENASTFRLSYRRSPKSPLEPNRKIANVVIAKNLNLSHHQVQTQALELIRGKRIFTRTAVHPAPKRFLFIALLASDSDIRLTPHLNNQFFISHYHSIDDGLPNLQEYRGLDDDQASLSSVVRPSSSMTFAPLKLSTKNPLLPQDELECISKLMADVRMSSEVQAYMQNLIAFLRLHRAVGGGISALATRHFELLVRALAPLHGLDYVPPSLVALAARKIYPHRIILTTPENERSMQWGSSLEAVREVLNGVTADDVIEDVLQQVEVPL